MSTRPLVALADFVVGVDVSKDMLAAAERLPGTTFAAATIERLPFNDGTVELASIASAIHWCEPHALLEVRRVMTHGAPLAVYDVWFPGEMVDVPAFSNWLSDVCGPRYAAVPKRHSNIDLLPSIGFERSSRTELRVPVPMTIEHLTDYLMTHSERIAAVRNGVETETQQQDFFLDGLREFYTEDRSREVLFGLELEVYQCV